jgi:hypothetical protein
MIHTGPVGYRPGIQLKEEDYNLDSHLVTLYQTDLFNAVATLLGEIAPRLIPHLPRHAPVAPFDQLTAMGNSVPRELVVHSAPAWRGNVRTAIEDDLITVAVRGADGCFVEVWRSDGVVPQRVGEPVPKPMPAPEPVPVPEPLVNFGPTQPGQVVEVDGYFTVAR